MSRYRVGHWLDFRVDRSITGGIWLDAGEWESLQAGNLHRSLHLLFTSPWQKAIRDEEQAANRHRRLREHFGDDFYERLESIRKEIWAHPRCAEALAFLEDKPDSP